MKQLLLADYAEETDIAERVMKDYEVSSEELSRYDILAAGYWAGDYEGSGWVLLMENATGELYENYGSHCSCYGLEGQWSPTKSSREFILSAHFNSRDMIAAEENAVRALVANLPTASSQP